MYIGKAAQLSGTTVKTIRHYEAIGLLPAARRQGRYRLYDEQSVELLRFIKCAQQLGFKLKELQALMPAQWTASFPWGAAQQALATKKQALKAQIQALETQCLQLEWFEGELTRNRQLCPV